jgi:hypothetical protein
MASDCHGVHRQVEQYLTHVEYVIELFRVGDLTEVEVIDAHVESSMNVTSAMTKALVDRLFEARTARAAAAAETTGPMEEYPSVVRTGAHRASTHQDQQVSSSGGAPAPPAAPAPLAGDE